LGKAELIDILGQDRPRVRSGLRQFYGVVWANLKIMLAYKSWVIMDLLSTVASVVMYYFVGLQVDPVRLSQSGWGTSYLAFSLIGVATSNYLWSCLTRLSHSIQHEIRGGTLETIAVTQVNMFTFFIGQTVRGYMVSLIFLVGVFAVGIAGLGVTFVTTAGSLTAALLTFLLMLISNQALGLVAAGIIMVHKRGDPIAFMVAGLNEFLAGVLYPLEMLSAFPLLHGISMMFPYTYALDGMRRALILGSSLTDPYVLNDVLTLALFSLVLIPAGLYVLNWGYRTIRRNGSTSSY
jgi:ABC-2 type transport system permease protein